MGLGASKLMFSKKDTNLSCLFLKDGRGCLSTTKDNLNWIWSLGNKPGWQLKPSSDRGTRGSQPDEISKTYCQKFLRQLGSILLAEVWPLQNFPHARKPSGGHGSFWKINAMTLVDDGVTPKVRDQFSLGDACIEQKSCISKMSRKAVTKFNK